MKQIELEIKSVDGTVTLKMVIEDILKATDHEIGDIVAIFDAHDTVVFNDEIGKPVRGKKFYILWDDGGFGSIEMNTPMERVDGQPNEVIVHSAVH